MIIRNHFIIRQILYCILASAVAFILTESIYRGGIEGFFGWIGEFPGYAFLTAVWMLAYFGMLHFLNIKGFILGGSLSIVLFSMFALIGYYKEKLRGDPLVPYDLAMVDEAGKMAAVFLDLPFRTIVIFVLLIVSLAYLLMYVISKAKNCRYTKKTLYFPTSSAILFTFLFYSMGDLFADEAASGLKEQYTKFGIIAGLASNLDIRSEAPEQYEEQIAKLVSRNEKGDEPKSMPNIIMIMSEAFWDPSVMENVTFNKDPLPNFHRLSAVHPSGNLIVPVFGGSTANTEFEVLTGLSTHFLPPGSIPYKNLVKSPLPALPFTLRSAGYETIALHMYHNWYYNRDEVYRLFGFDRFVSLEFFPKPVKDMMYYRDDEMIDEILKQVKRRDKPNFIFAVTMQNHGPYRTDAKKYYATVEVSLKGDKAFTKESENILEFYADNLVEADKQLGRLTESLQKIDEPSVVVFFGDHLPLLGEDYKVYKEAGFLQDNGGYKEYLKTFQTPVLVWSTEPLKNERLTLGSSFLAPYVLHSIGLEGNYLTNFLETQLDGGEAFLLPKEFNNNSTMDHKDQKTYESLQYDLLFGKKRGVAKSGINITPSKSYRLGYGALEVMRAEPARHEKGEAIKFTGRNFTSSTQVFINGEKKKSIFINETTLYALIPYPEEEFKVQLKIMDSEGSELSRSNSLRLKP
jgi:phosphoglycerol transferase MdoB-like AlkP superfamily enzyme